MSKGTRKRKRPYRAHEFGQVLSEALGHLGDGGHVKVLLPDGLAMHRVVQLTETIEEDVILWLEPAPCWRKRAVAGLAAGDGFWRQISTCPVSDNAVLVTDGKTVEAAVHVHNADGGFEGLKGRDLFWTPTHWAPLPKLLEASA